MYSALIADRRLHAAVKQTQIKAIRRPKAYCLEVTENLSRLRLDPEGNPLPNRQLARPLNRDEQDFISSEALICKCDFTYWLERYYPVEIDPGVSDKLLDKKIGVPADLLESQRRIISAWGKREEECYRQFAKEKFTTGIDSLIIKCRQILATTTSRGACLHRMLFWPGTRAFAASLDDDRISELYTRDGISLDHLVWFQKPELTVEKQNTQRKMASPINSRIDYQAENQVNGIGTGSQYDVSHLTEVPLWKLPGKISFSFTPSLPKAVSTLCIQEGTSFGKGDYWHEITESTRKRYSGFENYTYIFVPWYCNMMKYRANVPDSWQPTKETIDHAELIERTSPEFFDGKTIHPNRSQLYWWQTTRAQHLRKGELATFYTNYPATPEQSFQNFSQGALPAEVIEAMELECQDPIASYDLEVYA